MHNSCVLMKTVKSETFISASFSVHESHASWTFCIWYHSFSQLWPDDSCNFSLYLWPELWSPLRVFLHAHLAAWIHKPYPFCQDSLHWEVPVEQCWMKEGMAHMTWSHVTSQANPIGSERSLSWSQCQSRAAVSLMLEQMLTFITWFCEGEGSWIHDMCQWKYPPCHLFPLWTNIALLRVLWKPVRGG